PTESIQSFWMQNTYIPLDMIFISANKEVVGVVHDAEPLTLTSRRVDIPSLYVVEVNAGLAARFDIQSGTHVAFENVPDTDI
ncbi:DUF192 domain-containing protein, partial [Myxococcota bacterium]|nr:DUF192 domain-containing protein [Myxococcota bacterium]